MIALLFISLAIPAATALLLMLFRTSLNQSNARWVACCGSVAAMLFSGLLLLQYRTQFVRPWKQASYRLPPVLMQHRPFSPELNIASRG
jgi:NADH:ubiquinone oxidoreductase subunit 4 (subunit M)